MLTNGQKKAIHSAARQAGFEKEDYKLVIKNIGGFDSAADRTASREGFIAVMAFFESRANGALRGCTPGYWTEQERVASPRDPIIYKIRKIAEGMGIDADLFIAGQHMSNGSYASLEDAPTRWLTRCYEGLKAISTRRKDAAHGTPFNKIPF